MLKVVCVNHSNARKSLADRLVGFAINLLCVICSAYVELPRGMVQAVGQCAESMVNAKAALLAETEHAHGHCTGKSAGAAICDIAKWVLDKQPAQCSP